jgi:hypothetical protein
MGRCASFKFVVLNFSLGPTACTKLLGQKWGGKGEQTSSQVRGVAFQLPPGKPPGLGTQATPMFFCMMPSPRTPIVSLYGNFLEINSKDQKMLWCEMVKPSDDHALLDMSFMNSKAIVDLFQDKAITYLWMRFMRIPTASTGAIFLTPKCSPGAKDIFHADLSNFKNLIEDFNHITLEQVMAFTS